MTTFFLDDFPLDDPGGRWRLTTETELPSLSLLENRLVTAPFMDGAARVRGSAPTRPITLGLLIPNRADNGRDWYGPSHGKVMEMASLLGLAFSSAKNLVIQMDDGRKRQAKILNVAASELKMAPTRAFATIAFSLDLEPYWMEDRIVESAPAVATQNVVFSGFEDMTGPARDLVFRLAGPADSLTIIHPATGEWITAPTGAASGSYLYLDVGRGVYWMSYPATDFMGPRNPIPADTGPEGVPVLYPEFDYRTGLSNLRLHAVVPNAGGRIVARGHRWFI